DFLNASTKALLVDSFKAEYTEILPLAALAILRLPTRAAPTPLAVKRKKCRLLHVLANCVCTFRSSLSFSALRAPHPPADLTHEPQFGLLVCRCERAASLYGGKAALRTECQPLQGHVLARLPEPCLNGRGILQYGALRGQQPEHHRVLRQDVPQGVKVPS